MNFDIDAIERSTRNTFDVIVGHLPGADGQPDQPVGFKVLGPGSDEYAAAQRQVQLLNVREAGRRKKAVDLDTEEGAAAVVDGGDQRRRVLLNQCVVGWFGFTVGDAPAEFNRENLVRVLKARPHWELRLIAAIEDEGNFTAG